MKILFIFGLLMAQSLSAADCSDNKETQVFCEQIDLTLSCLRGQYRCDKINAMGGTLSASLYYLGIVEGKASSFASMGELKGGVAAKLDLLLGRLSSHRWNGWSKDLNWIAAINESNRLIDDSYDRLKKMR